MLFKDLDLKIIVLAMTLERILKNKYLIPFHVETICRIRSAMLFSCKICHFNIKSILGVLINLTIKWIYY